MTTIYHCQCCCCSTCYSRLKRLYSHLASHFRRRFSFNNFIIRYGS